MPDRLPANQPPLPVDGFVQLLLRDFLTIRTLPPAWKPLDLYSIREAETVIYVGQSDCAYQRLWQHILTGPHGHSIVGRFLLVNWPRSGFFTVELYWSGAARFAEVTHVRLAAEQCLIESYHPCFNVSRNRQPSALPAGCLPVNTPLRPFHSLKRMLREAAYAPRAADGDTDWK